MKKIILGIILFLIAIHFWDAKAQSSRPTRIDDLYSSATDRTKSHDIFEFIKQAAFNEIATPSPNPAAGKHFMYPKADGFFYTLNSAGTESKLGGVSMNAPSDNNLIRTDGVTSDTLQSTGIFIDDSDNITGAGNITMGGATIGTLTGILKGSTGVVSAGTVDLTSEVNGTLPIANGGTNSSTVLNNNFVMISSGGSIVEDANISVTELFALDNIAGNIQTELDGKIDDYSGLTTGCSMYADSATTIACSTILHDTTDNVLDVGTGVTTKATRFMFPLTQAEIDALTKSDMMSWFNETDEVAEIWFNGEAIPLGGGGAGGSRLGLLEFKSFERGKVGEGTCTNCTATAETTIVLNTPTNEGSLKVVGSSAGDYTIDKTTGAEWGDSTQMVAECWVKTADTGISFHSRRNGANVDTLTVSPDNKWNKYEIPIVSGSTSNGLQLAHDGTQTYYADECDVKPRNDLVKEITGSFYVGKVAYANTNCNWQRNNTSWGDFPTDADCTGVFEEGQVTYPDTRIPAVKILNVRTDGHYKVTAVSTMFSGIAPPGVCYYNLSESTVVSGDNGTVNTFDTADRVQTLIGSFQFDGSNQDETVRILNKRVNGAGNCEISASGDTATSFVVTFHPDEPNRFVAQRTKLLVVEVEDNDDDAVGAGAKIKFKEGAGTYDNFGAWSIDTFTAPYEICVVVRGMVRQNANTQDVIQLYVNGSLYKNITSNGSGNASFQKQLNPIRVCLNKGETLSIRPENAITLDNLPDNHYLRIYEEPEDRVFVGEFKGKKCQTKLLTGDIGSSTLDIADLNFSGITIGKTYEVKAQAYIVNINGTGAKFNIRHDGSNISTVAIDDNETTTDSENRGYTGPPTFIATNTTITSEVVLGAGGGLRGNNTQNETWVQVCELPNKMTTTTEW